MTHLMGPSGPPCALQSLPDAGASRRGPRLPGGLLGPIKWVIINAPWYKNGAAKKLGGSTE